MKKKIRNLTIAELNKFCDKQYYTDGKACCENCPLCQRFSRTFQTGFCAIGDNMGTIEESILDLEVEVDGK